MENLNQPENIEPQQELSSNTETQVIDDVSKKSQKTLWIIGILSIIGLCICGGVCAFFAGSGIYEAFTEKDNVGKTVDDFMKAMEKRDTEEAYSLFSTRVKRQLQISAIEEMISEANYALFDEYEKVEVQNINLSNVVNTNPDVPQGKVAKVNGVVTYMNDYTGSFQATLEQENDGWRLHFINITVPPNKIKDFLEKN
ncbi:MAG: hypothetical protein GY797_26090 [Deltaproteobacteria bacterium]|nr:hypothetical protein [Deltaproteobacteria bacterium]